MADSLNHKAKFFHSLHLDGPVLLLPNAWDAASAALIAGVGASAIGTTSAGVAWSHGFPDGQLMERDDMMRAVARIVAAVDVPVTADVEAGYGPTPQEVADTVRGAIAAGAVGINLEDSRAAGGPLFGLKLQSERIGAARDSAGTSGVPNLVINARSDVFLLGVGDPTDRLNEVRSRAEIYAEAGADCLFVPGLLDLRGLETLCEASPLPVNAMAMPGGPTVDELNAVGVRRISLGALLAQVAYDAAGVAAEELLSSGTYTASERAARKDLNALLSDGDR